MSDKEFFCGSCWKFKPLSEATAGRSGGKPMCQACRDSQERWKAQRAQAERAK